MLDKELMAEAAILYYEKNLTQQEIANKLYLSRQTVSKLLNEAIRTKVVEIHIHQPKKDCEKLEGALQSKFNLKKAVLCSTASQNEEVRQLVTVKAATEYLLPFMLKGNLNIAMSWGRTIQTLIAQFPTIETNGNTVYPLFGATDHEESCFLSNEIARGMADKIKAKARYVWFPYLPNNLEDRDLFKKTSYYQHLLRLWDTIDIAIVGIGNTKIIDLFERTFGHAREHSSAVGDIATHFFSQDGKILNLYQNTLRATTENLKNAKNVVAIACGDDKVTAITGALRSNLIDTLITDEHTAKELLR